MKACIFDLDGTLVDSMWMWDEIDVEFLGDFGYDVPETLHREIEGMSFSETAVYFKDTFSLPLTLDEIKARWIEMSLDKYRYEVPAKTGVPEFLAYLKDNGIKTAIATSNSRDMVEAVLESLAIGGCFDAVVTASEVEKGKPEPDIYLEAAGKLGIPPEECVVFEDVPAGITAGKRAGMTVIAVKDSFSEPLDDEKSELADGFIKDYFEMFP